jgi:glutamyl-tRNA synthetase
VNTHHETRTTYRSRLAPSPTGLLHLGHARTFWIAQQRACTQNGTLILRNEDLDRSRCRPEFVSAMFEDLRWFGLKWREGPDCGGPYGPYSQSERFDLYRAAFEKLKAGGFVYPCTCSRQDVLRALQAPHAGEDEPLYPGTCRPKAGSRLLVESCRLGADRSQLATCNLQPATSVPQTGTRPNYRFRIPEGETISFVDARCGPQLLVAARDFGDFVVWRHDDTPAYQLAVVVDDAAMRVTEVVRGEDLLKSTARQLLLYRALGLAAPAFYHCPLVTDDSGTRLAKRHDALSLRALRAQGFKPEQLRNGPL